MKLVRGGDKDLAPSSGSSSVASAKLPAPWGHQSPPPSGEASIPLRVEPTPLSAAHKAPRGRAPRHRREPGLHADTPTELTLP